MCCRYIKQTSKCSIRMAILHMRTKPPRWCTIELRLCLCGVRTAKYIKQVHNVHGFNSISGLSDMTLKTSSNGCKSCIIMLFTQQKLTISEMVSNVNFINEFYHKNPPKLLPHTKKGVFEQKCIEKDSSGCDFFFWRNMYSDFPNVAQKAIASGKFEVSV